MKKVINISELKKYSKKVVVGLGLLGIEVLLCNAMYTMGKNVKNTNSISSINQTHMISAVALEEPLELNEPKLLKIGNVMSTDNINMVYEEWKLTKTILVDQWLEPSFSETEKRVFVGTTIDDNGEKVYKYEDYTRSVVPSVKPEKTYEEWKLTKTLLVDKWLEPSISETEKRVFVGITIDDNGEKIYKYDLYACPNENNSLSKKLK